jgi:hypothetical protein
LAILQKNRGNSYPNERQTDSIAHPRIKTSSRHAHYRNLTGLGKLSVTADPDIVTHIITGSDPTLSAVALPEVVAAFPGRVTGIVVPQLLPFAVTVTAVILFPSFEYL